MKVIILLYLLISLNTTIYAQNNLNIEFKSEIHKTINDNKYIHYIKTDNLGYPIYKCQGLHTKKYVIKNKKSHIENNFFFKKYFYSPNKILVGSCTINYGTCPILNIYKYDSLNRVEKISRFSYTPYVQLDLRKTIDFLINLNIQQIDNFVITEITNYYYEANKLAKILTLKNNDTISSITYTYSDAYIKEINSIDYQNYSTKIVLTWNLDSSNTFPSNCIIKSNQYNNKIVFSKKSEVVYLANVINLKQKYPKKIDNVEIVFDPIRNNFEYKDNRNIIWNNNYFQFIVYLCKPNFIELEFL